MKSVPKTLFTLGYEGLELPEFIEILRQNGVQVVADLRAVPHSRKKGYSKKALSEELARHGIEYVLIQELGTPKPLRDQVRASEDYDSFFIAYTSYLDTQPGALKKLLDIARNHVACLLCFERDINHCHRKAVSERLLAISAGKFKIIHLNQSA
jgi:uncharacterized protein (DUF488 family)